MSRQPFNKEDLSPEVRQKILDALHENKDWKRLEVKYAKALKYGNIIQLSQTKALMNKLKNDCLQAYCDSFQTEQITMNKLFQEMPRADADKLREMLDSIYFLLDVLDTLILDADGLLRKHCPDCELAFYDKILELRKEVQTHVDGVLDKSDEKQSELIWKYSDMITNYTMRKVKDFLKEEKKITAQKRQE